MPDCEHEGCHDLEQLRRDLDQKHQQNRTDIHRLRNDQQKLLLEFTKLEGKVMPLVDNGQPGLISKILTRLEDVVEELNRVQVNQASMQGTDVGRRGEHDWWRTAIAPLLVGLAIILVSHFWK